MWTTDLVTVTLLLNSKQASCEREYKTKVQPPRASERVQAYLAVDHAQGAVHDRPQYDPLCPDGEPAVSAARYRRRRRDGSVRDHLFRDGNIRTYMAQQRVDQHTAAHSGGNYGRLAVRITHHLGRTVAHDLAQSDPYRSGAAAHGFVHGGGDRRSVHGLFLRDMLPQQRFYRRHLPMGRVLLMTDMMVISSAFFLPTIQAAGTQGAIEKILFGLTYTFMSSTAVDWVMNRMRQSVQFMIFTQKPDEIAEAIITQAHRGCTFLEAEGGYYKQPMKVVTTIARSYESATIFRLVRSIDPNAFVSQSQVRGVFGQGFDPMANGK